MYWVGYTLEKWKKNPWFNILLHTQSIVCVTVSGQCLEYYVYSTLHYTWKSSLLWEICASKTEKWKNVAIKSTLVWHKMFAVKNTSLNKVTCGDDFTIYMTEIIYQLGRSTQMQKEPYQENGKSETALHNYKSSWD